MRLMLVCLAALAISGCAARQNAWRLVPSGADIMIVPPSVRTKIDAAGVKITPQVALQQRRQRIADEDKGRLAPGAADRILVQALESQAVPVSELWYLRFGGSRDAGYIGVFPGWRLRVITPLFRSGVYRVNGDKLGPDFLGMETAYYSVEPGVHVRLTSAEAVIDGKQEPRTEAKAALFAIPAFVRHLRLLYLTRRSAADHDMAIVGARTFAELEAATAKVGSGPEDACATTERVHCSWVPSGIAVLPQVSVTFNGIQQWVAANSTVGDVVRTGAATVLRPWKGKLVPVEGSWTELRKLPLLGGEAISALP